MTDVPPLIAAAATIAEPFDVAAAAAEIVLPEPEGVSPAMIWLTLVAVRAGLGLPPDPLRPRGWMTFGRLLDEGDAPVPGDVVLMRDGEGEIVGILADAGDPWRVLIAPDQYVELPSIALVSARRPIQQET